MKDKRTEGNEDIYNLVEQVKKGNREAFMTVIRFYQKKVFLLAFSYFRNREDALDIVQETFLRFYQKVNMFKRNKDFSNWLLQITKNLCIDYYRKNYKHSKNAELDAEKGIAAMDFEGEKDHDFCKSSDFKEIFSRCLNRLSEKQRMIFVMRHYNQLDYKEIAQILDVAIGTVKSLHFKAINKLKIIMSPYLGRI